MKAGRERTGPTREGLRVGLLMGADVAGEAKERPIRLCPPRPGKASALCSKQTRPWKATAAMDVGIVWVWHYTHYNSWGKLRDSQKFEVFSLACA